jgi:hypothetical protein
VGEFDQTSAIADPAAKSIFFSVELPAGTCPLQTWFLDENGQEICGAYAVYVKGLVKRQ